MNQPNVLRPLTDTRLKALEAAASRYANDAMLSDNFADWVARRGLTEETATGFRLGVVEDPLPGHNGYRGRIAIPFINANEQVVQLRFRCAQPHSCDGHPKYLGEPGDDVRLFNTRALTNPVIDLHLCEGEIDCMILTQLGFNAVAVPGVGAWHGRHVQLMHGYRRVYVWGDGDQAGRDFARRVHDDVRHAIAVPLPDGEDINSLFLRGGEASVRALFEQLLEVYA